MTHCPSRRSNWPGFFALKAISTRYWLDKNGTMLVIAKRFWPLGGETVPVWLSPWLASVSGVVEIPALSSTEAERSICGRPEGTWRTVGDMSRAAPSVGETTKVGVEAFPLSVEFQSRGPCSWLSTLLAPSSLDERTPSSWMVWLACCCILGTRCSDLRTAPNAPDPVPMAVPTKLP